MQPEEKHAFYEDCYQNSFGKIADQKETQLYFAKNYVGWLISRCLAKYAYKKALWMSDKLLRFLDKRGMSEQEVRPRELHILILLVCGEERAYGDQKNTTAPSCGHWELNWSPLQRRQVRFTAESPL